MFHLRAALQRFRPIAKLILFAVAFSAFSGFARSAELTVTLENNQPFRIHMPVRLHCVSVADGHSTLGSSQSLQALGTDAVFIADIAAGAHQHLAVKSGGAGGQGIFSLKPAVNGVELIYAGESQGRLSWDIFLKPVQGSVDSRSTNREDFNAAFSALPLAFKPAASGPVFNSWTAEAIKAGLKLKIELLAYADGFLDINARLTNESADPVAKVYAAVICCWEEPKVSARTLCYDNRISPLGDKATSPFRSGEGRHQFTQRGADWVRSAFASGVTAAWLNAFEPSFTVLDKTSHSQFKQPRYEGASLPQLGQEVQTAGQKVYSVTEIARANIKSYRDRLAENVLPTVGDGVVFTSRVVFSKKSFGDEETDQMLVGWSSYNQQSSNNNGVAVAFGVPSVRFGTSYFPYSTLGENFDELKLPGMDRDGFWPLAADTVLHWRDFADDIRGDLRIAKTMGFQLIRLHHLELLGAIPKDTRQEYLDFIFSELRHLKLHALVDIYASDEAIAELLKRYGDVIDSVEIENEILIWGIPVDRPEQWKKTYKVIKQAAPQVRVHLTGYNNTGMFNRLASLGVPFDRVGLHSYMDSLDAIPTARGYALALGSFCSKIGKPPVITEWNWRQLTRMTPDARAKIYPAVFDNALATRAIPEMYQFQFNETLAPNLRTGRGNVLRHYELINLSRRPKPEALELAELIKKYSAANDPLRTIEIPHLIFNLNEQGTAQNTVRIKNSGRQTQHLKVAIESPQNLKAELEDSGDVVLRAGQTKTMSVKIKTAGTTPGFYHFFLRVEGDDGFLRYGWIETRLVGAPKIDLESKSTISYPRGVREELTIDFTKPTAVVYGQDAPVLEVETAFAIASTLESATGQPIDSFQLADVPEGIRQHGNLILVGTRKSNAMITKLQDRLPATGTNFVARVDNNLVVCGDDSLAAEQAGMDLLLRWWKNAKDSAARRVGLVKKELPRGGDAAKLP